MLSVLYRHRLPETFPALHWFMDEEARAGKLFILRRWCFALDFRAA